MPTYRTSYLKDYVLDRTLAAYRALRGGEPDIAPVIRQPDRPEFGDYSTNLAMILASQEGVAPRTLADELVDALSAEGFDAGVKKVETAGPGFINVFLSPQRIRSTLESILADGARYGKHSLGERRKLQVEFVSSNPTGPLTVGHGRQAVLGDVLARLFEWIGQDVYREYYFNDEGRQVDLLAESLWARHKALHGEQLRIPVDGYHGEYLANVALDVDKNFLEGVRFLSFKEMPDEARPIYRREAVTRMTEWIKRDLADLGVRFDTWFSEATLHRSGKVDAALAKLREAGGTFEEDGAVWLKAEEHGGAKDSVLIRSDGRPTYLMVDIAYHINKHDERGFDHVINVQGADHHAEQSCMKAAMRILGYPEEWLSYAVHQFVSLKEGGETLKMSTRAGRFVTLRDLIDDLGKDIVRWFMISRKPEAHLDFDLDLARAESLDNPATYVQYAHTRILSVFRKAEEQGIVEADWSR
ncbi:arginine--tRNA ligase, partial [Candidatus Bipolaricaulota bacterium]|nr:arginine--tRNA ligase [Candidatus Bipolaricaulota bacterium]